jgi:hypothetical protein
MVPDLFQPDYLHARGRKEQHRVRDSGQQKSGAHHGQGCQGDQQDVEKSP